MRDVAGVRRIRCWSDRDAVLVVPIESLLTTKLLPVSRSVDALLEYLHCSSR